MARNHMSPQDYDLYVSECNRKQHKKKSPQELKFDLRLNNLSGYEMYAEFKEDITTSVYRQAMCKRCGEEYKSDGNCLCDVCVLDLREMNNVLILGQYSKLRPDYLI